MTLPFVIDCSDVVEGIMREFIQTQLLVYDTRALKVLETVAVLCPRLVSRCAQHLKETVKAVEVKRGVGHDTKLR